ncbi:hypothetical protein OEM_21680 [Mycobacterium intracellulare subsp. yongonense 05-1390]|nr:hypothetical protein OEM_21680 [Mycobacterium intracellulare subsp. yongonense 05-1390]
MCWWRCRGTAAGACLRSRADVEDVDCADLATGRDIDEPA